MSLTNEQVDEFEQANAQLEGLYTEIDKLSKKKPDDAVNKFKIKFINSVLLLANNVLGDEEKPFKDFSQFDEAEMPTNSDVAMIVAQYINCMEKYRIGHIVQSYTKWYWLITGEDKSRRTSAPKSKM